ncbi:hypothetical protein Nepgr_018621 [Nepenthes gracilis]|uniref:Uncharacterized protein n=1 Tax=Nepenthes gracilis TaxID=150966 RepID=A0AAD3STM7_NEPGR|nr:hypothetical protein Nepgr_018621 [Nepenthes gracilis]
MAAEGTGYRQILPLLVAAAAVAGGGIGLKKHYEEEQQQLAGIDENAETEKMTPSAFLEAECSIPLPSSSRKVDKVLTQSRLRTSHFTICCFSPENLMPASFGIRVMLESR